MYDVLNSFELFFQVKQPNMIIDQANVFAKRVFFLSGHNIPKGVTHDGNNHVHEYDDHQESENQKGKPKQVIILTMNEAAVMEITKSKHVDSNNGI